MPPPQQNGLNMSTNTSAMDTSQMSSAAYQGQPAQPSEPTNFNYEYSEILNLPVEVVQEPSSYGSNLRETEHGKG